MSYIHRDRTRHRLRDTPTAQHSTYTCCILQSSQLCCTIWFISAAIATEPACSLTTWITGTCTDKSPIALPKRSTKAVLMSKYNRTHPEREADDSTVRNETENRSLRMGAQHDPKVLARQEAFPQPNTMGTFSCKASLIVNLQMLYG